MKERIYFDREAHLKTRDRKGEETCNGSAVSTSSSESSCASSSSSESSVEVVEYQKASKSKTNRIFQRRFLNPDMATCWLNSCLQIVLCAMDQNSVGHLFNS